ncbi:MAG TPA: hypothetical protein VH678_15695 [Xanthobacteraceae bacterium]|jgi:hypothetical protein
MVEPERGPKNKGKVIGECRGKDYYTSGSHCPLRWEPSGRTIALARLEYWAWRQGLLRLAAEIHLDAHEALPPAAPAQPWLVKEAPRRIFTVGEALRT